MDTEVCSRSAHRSIHVTKFRRRTLWGIILLISRKQQHSRSKQEKLGTGRQRTLMKTYHDISWPEFYDYSCHNNKFEVQKFLRLISDLYYRWKYHNTPYYDPPSFINRTRDTHIVAPNTHYANGHRPLRRYDQKGNNATRVSSVVGLLHPPNGFCRESTIMTVLVRREVLQVPHQLIRTSTLVSIEITSTITKY